MSARVELVQELKLLRKGRGVFTSRIGQRIGPVLRLVCSVTDDDGPVIIRRKVANRLTALTEQLPADLRLAALAAFGLIEEARLPLFQDRMHWVAVRADRDSRTMRRRVDEAIGQLAELATGTHDGAGDEVTGKWHTTELRVTAVLDLDRPEVLEQRRIIANQDGLRELDLAVSVPVGRGELDVGVFYGGTLVDRSMEASDRIGFGIALPRPLGRGESHDVAVRFRLPTAGAMWPHLVCVPKRPCELFDLRVRFGQARRPTRVWLLRGAFQRDVSDPAYHGERHQVDPAGEIHLQFHQLTPGLAFGARWVIDG